MKTRAVVLLFVLILTNPIQAERLVPSSLDSNLSPAREEAFIPWSTPEESGRYWNERAKTNIPVFYERKEGNLSRDLYIPNPGIGYWVLGGLNEAQLFKTHRDKLKIGDTLISATVHQDEKGNSVYWALWAPADRAYLLTDRMKELGISQARIEYNLADRFEIWMVSLKPFSGFITTASLVLNGVLLQVVVVLGFKVFSFVKRNRSAEPV